MSASVDISGFLKGLAEARRRKLAAAKKALGQFANHVIGDSQQLTPVKTGTLKASGIAGDVEEKNGGLEVVIGHNTDYAAAVHERLPPKVKHSQGEAKFLESALKKNAPKFESFIGARVKAVE